MSLEIIKSKIEIARKVDEHLDAKPVVKDPAEVRSLHSSAKTLFGLLMNADRINGTFVPLGSLYVRENEEDAVISHGSPDYHTLIPAGPAHRSRTVFIDGLGTLIAREFKASSLASDNQYELLPTRLRQSRVNDKLFVEACPDPIVQVPSEVEAADQDAVGSLQLGYDEIYSVLEAARLLPIAAPRVASS
jgi:hypothetical protein